MNSVTVIIFLVRFAFSKYEHCQGKPMEKKKRIKGKQNYLMIIPNDSTGTKTTDQIKNIKDLTKKGEPL